MNIKHFSLTLIMLAMSILTFADDKPYISPTATFIVSEGTEEVATSYEGSAPLQARFEANPSRLGNYSAYYEWRFYKEGEDSPYLIRYEQDTEYTFTTAGAHRVVCYAVFTQDDDVVSYTEDYWTNNPDPQTYWSENAPEPGVITVSIYESKLDMPNAFSPNGDDYNQIYKAKEGYKSIIEFHAYIFNRWGQKLYEWHDPAGGWDGTYNGHDVAEGVYFCLVKAKGADGRKFNIRKDVNLLRGFTETSGATGEQ